MSDGNSDYTDIDNAITILVSQAAGERGPTHRAMMTAIEALRRARKALEERDAELEQITAPERDAAAELVRMREQNAALQARCGGLEQELAMLRQEQEVEGELHAEEKKRLQQLEEKARDFDSILLEDQDAFSRYMEKALDEDERRDSGKKRRG